MEIESIEKIDAEDGDILLVTLPDKTMSRKELSEWSNAINKQFRNLLDNKDVKIAILHSGMKVELLKTSQLENRSDA